MAGIVQELGGGCATATCANSWCTTDLRGRPGPNKSLPRAPTQFCGWCIKKHTEWEENPSRTEDGPTYAFRHDVNAVVHEHIANCIRRPGGDDPYFARDEYGNNITNARSQEALGGRAGDMLKNKLDSPEWHALSAINKGKVMSFFLKMQKYHNMRGPAKLRYDTFENFSRPGAVKEDFGEKGNRGFGLSWLIKDNILPSFLGGSIDRLGPDIINAGQVALAERTSKVQVLKNKLRDLEAEGQRQDVLPDPVVPPAAGLPEPLIPPPMGDHEGWESLNADDIQSKIVAIGIQIEDLPNDDGRLIGLRHELETLLVMIESRAAVPDKHDELVKRIEDVQAEIDGLGPGAANAGRLDKLTVERARLLGILHGDAAAAPDPSTYRHESDVRARIADIRSAIDEGGENDELTIELAKLLSMLPPGDDGQRRGRVQREEGDNDSHRAEIISLITGQIGINMNEVDRMGTKAATIFRSALNLYRGPGNDLTEAQWEEFYMEAKFNWAKHVITNFPYLDTDMPEAILADLASSNIQVQQRALRYAQTELPWKVMDVNGNIQLI